MAQPQLRLTYSLIASAKKNLDKDLLSCDDTRALHTTMSHFISRYIDADSVLDTTSAPSSGPGSLAESLGRAKGETLRVHEVGIASIAALHLPEVRKLTLTSNGLTSVDGLRHCVKASLLNLARNKLSGKGVGGAIAHMPELATLNVAYNQVKKLPQKSLKVNKVLKALIANDNQIASTPACLGRMRLLNTLVLSRNCLQVLPSAHLSAALTKLSLQHNALVELPDLTHCKVLQTVRVTHNRINVFPTKVPASLTLLDVGSNSIGDASWVHIEVRSEG